HSTEHPESTVNLSLGSSAQSGEQDDINKKRRKGKSPIDYFTGNRDFNEDFEDYSEDISNDISTAGHIVPTAGQNYFNNTNSISAAEEPKRVHQALKDPSWIEAMHEELFQFKMQKVWILVDLPHGKRAIENGFHGGQIDQTLFIKKQKGDILLVQIYVDDIIFGVTNKDLSKSFEELMKDKFQMSSMRELTFFLGLQVKQKEDGIF
nr:putative ribonuclease H-like domain-containing protein [Tanacetum cinerariifolium]